MRNKLGIIQLELSEITLDGVFNSETQTEITTLLNEEQKEIIRTRGDSKLVLVKTSFKDSNDVNIVLNGIMNRVDDYLQIFGYSYSDSSFITISLIKSGSKYYAIS